MIAIPCLLALSVVRQVTVDGDLADIRAVAQASTSDPVNEVCVQGRSGFDFSYVYVYYSPERDAVYVGLNVMDVPGGVGIPGLGVPGDTDGDGDPDSPATNIACVAPPFEDQDGVGSDEVYWIFLDPNNGGGFEDDIVAQYRGNRLDFVTWPHRNPIPGVTGAIALGTLGSPHHPTHIPDENPATSDIELRVDHWSALDPTPWEFGVFVVTSAESGLPGDSTNFVLVNVSTSCAAGTVDSSAGLSRRVLTVNGHDDVGLVPRSTPITVSLSASPVGPNPARYSLWVWAGSLNGSRDLSARGSTLGCTVGATPLRPFEQPQPFRCVQSPDLPQQLCRALSEPNAPTHAPWSITRRAGFSVPITLTMQGILEDSGSSNPLGFSVTNVIVVDVR